MACKQMQLWLFVHGWAGYEPTCLMRLWCSNGAISGCTQGQGETGTVSIHSSLQLRSAQGIR
jgi:hypothetical protein